MAVTIDMSAYSDQRVSEVISWLNEQFESGREFIEPAELIYYLHLKPLCTGVTTPLWFFDLDRLDSE